LALELNGPGAVMVQAVLSCGKPLTWEALHTSLIHRRWRQASSVASATQTSCNHSVWLHCILHSKPLQQCTSNTFQASVVGMGTALTLTCDAAHACLQARCHASHYAESIYELCMALADCMVH